MESLKNLFYSIIKIIWDKRKTDTFLKISTLTQNGYFNSKTGITCDFSEN